MTTRRSFDEELQELQREILRMGSLVEEAIYRAVTALAKQDTALAQQVIGNDDRIDDYEAEIEEKCITLIALQQPMAKDLRRISTGFKLITDLERMGDLAVEIARITLRLAGQTYIKPLIDIPRMAALAQGMVRDSLNAYVNEDIALARQLAERDDEVDHLYKQIFRELLTYMMEDPRNISQATHFLFAARHLERIADHATNIGEKIIYQVTGERSDLNL